ncbi:MAG: hypothetical protein ACU84H_13365 [Gammaproteobacteria bacterium]
MNLLLMIKDERLRSRLAGWQLTFLLSVLLFGMPMVIDKPKRSKLLLVHLLVPEYCHLILILISDFLLSCPAPNCLPGANSDAE